MRDNLRRLGRRVVHNRSLKAASLLLALITWYAIRGVISYEVVVRGVPLEFVLDPGTAVTDQSETMVDVTFRGSREEVRMLEHKHIRAVVDLRGVHETEHAIETAISPQDVEGGLRAVRAVRVDPGRVVLRLDREEDRRVRVRAVVQGKPLIGKISKVACVPEEVTLHGPGDKIKGTEVLPTETVDVEGRVETFTKRVAVLPPGETWGSRIEPSEVRVTVTIVKESSQRTLDDVQVAALIPPGAGFSVDVTPPVVSVTLSGEAEALDRVPVGAIKAFVDCAAGLQAGAAYDLPVKVHLGAGPQPAVKVTPEIVEVRLRERD